MTAREFWNARSAVYDVQVGTQYAAAYEKTVEKMLPYLAPHDRVLDFACGTGLVALPLAQRGMSVRAIDISEEMVRRTQEKAAALGLENVTVSQTDLFDESLCAGSFDAVLACNVLLYVENRAAVLARIRELLRPEGVFLSVTDCLGEGWTRERIVKWWRVRQGKMPYVAFDTMRALEREIASAGFAVLETENLYPAPPNLFVAARRQCQQYKK